MFLQFMHLTCMWLHYLTFPYSISILEFTSRKKTSWAFGMFLTIEGRSERIVIYLGIFKINKAQDKIVPTFTEMPAHLVIFFQVFSQGLHFFFFLHLCFLPLPFFSCPPSFAKGKLCDSDHAPSTTSGREKDHQPLKVKSPNISQSGVLTWVAEVRKVLPQLGRLFCCVVAATNHCNVLKLPRWEDSCSLELRLQFSHLMNGFIFFSFYGEKFQKCLSNVQA